MADSPKERGQLAKRLGSVAAAAAALVTQQPAPVDAHEVIRDLLRKGAENISKLEERSTSQPPAIILRPSNAVDAEILLAHKSHSSHSSHSSHQSHYSSSAGGMGLGASQGSTPPSSGVSKNAAKQEAPAARTQPKPVVPSSQSERESREKEARDKRPKAAGYPETKEQDAPEPKIQADQQHFLPRLRPESQQRAADIPVLPATPDSPAPPPNFDDPTQRYELVSVSRVNTIVKASIFDRKAKRRMTVAEKEKFHTLEVVKIDLKGQQVTLRDTKGNEIVLDRRAEPESK